MDDIERLAAIQEIKQVMAKYFWVSTTRTGTFGGAWSGRRTVGWKFPRWTKRTSRSRR